MSGEDVGSGSHGGNGPANEEDHWNFHFNVLGPNSAEVSRVFESLIRTVPGLAFHFAAQQPPAAPGHPVQQFVGNAPLYSAASPHGEPLPKRKVGRPSKAETQRRLSLLSAASGGVGPAQPAASSIPCCACGAANPNRLLNCGHRGCERCMIPYLSMHGICPECFLPCAPRDLRPVA